MSDSGSTSGFTIVDFTVPTRDTPVVHPCAEAPICDDCRSADLCFFDPTCSSCQDVLSNPKTTISELFAIMRQWIPQTQGHLTLLTREVLRRGAHINDKDGLTDLSLLHFASKAGAVGIGNGTTAASLVNTLINKGANTDLKCHWTDMNALHYAVFFDCAEVVDLLCEHDPTLVVSVSSQFEGGNPLHIAALSLSLASAKILLKHKADGGLADSNNLLPHQCVPEGVTRQEEPLANELRELLREASLNRPTITTTTATTASIITTKTIKHSDSSSSVSSSLTRSPVGKTTPTTTPTTTPISKADNKGTKSIKTDSVRQSLTFNRQDSRGTSQHSIDSGSPVVISNSPALSSLPSTQASGSPADEVVTLESLGVKIGGRVMVDGGTAKAKKGTLRFAGETMFSSGQWAGVELDDDTGRNDGSHAGIRYFQCKPKRGLFVALKRISKLSQQASPVMSGSGSVTPKVGGATSRKSSTPLVDVRSSSSRAMESHSQVQISPELRVGDHVLVSGKDRGILRYAGAVKFAPGYWLGIELDTPRGNCDGTKGGKQYFKCRSNYGVFVLPSKISKLRSKDSIDIPSTGSTPSPNPPQSSVNLSDKKKKPVSHMKSSSSSGSKGHSSGGASYSSPLPSSLSLANAPDITLEKGMSVFANKEKATVQYIGHTDFAPGVWLGLELKKPSGRNDGSVNGKRYFSCKPLYGIFVKPERATHRGINCSKILKIDTK